MRLFAHNFSVKIRRSNKNQTKNKLIFCSSPPQQMNNPISLLDKWPPLCESKTPEYAKIHHDWIKALSLEVFNLKVLVSSLDEKNRVLEDRIKQQDNEISLLKAHKEDKGFNLTDNSSEETSKCDHSFEDINASS